MAAHSPCPPETQLRRLLTGRPAGFDEAQLTAHLDWCDACRRRLEELAGIDPSLLEAAPGGDNYAQELPLRRVLHLLAANPELTTIQRPGDRALRVPRSPAPEMPDALGGCEVTRILGQGGMGVVYQAYDPALKRWVAIKVLSPHLASDPVARLRFAREAQAAAAVGHENVIAIHAVSEVDGLPYIVMEYLAGGSLQDYIDQYGRPGWQVAARIAAEVASGLAAAHARGLVHRDIKPSNVLLQASDAPRVPGAAKISDFGLARVADDSRLTRTGLIAGTPMYMSPEQSLAEPVDHRADLFSLGSVLYSLCTGREPFPGGSPVVVLRQVCEFTPTPVRLLNPSVPFWLAALVERLHAKRPADRLTSAAEVAELLRHNLEHPDRPRLVPPPRRVSHAGRYKHRLVVGAALVCLFLPGGLMLSGSASRPAPGLAVSRLEERPQRVPERATLRGHSGPVWAICFSPDGRTLATGSDDSTLRFWDAGTGRELAVLSGHRSAVFAAAFAHSGKLLISGNGDGSIRLWNVADRKETAMLPHGNGSVRRVAVSPDDRTLAVGGNTQDVELWDLQTGTLRQALPGSDGTIMAVAFAADGRTLATGDARGNIRLWDPATGSQVSGFSGDPLAVRALAFSPDRKTLASAGTGDKDLKLWRYSAHEKLATFPWHDHGPSCLAFSPDGSLLAAGSREGDIIIRDVRTGRSRAMLRAQQGAVYALAFAPDGRTLASAGEDKQGRLWDLQDMVDSKP